MDINSLPLFNLPSENTPAVAAASPAQLNFQPSSAQFLAEAPPDALSGLASGLQTGMQETATFNAQEAKRQAALQAEQSRVSAEAAAKSKEIVGNATISARQRLAEFPDTFTINGQVATPEMARKALKEEIDAARAAGASAPDLENMQQSLDTFLSSGFANYRAQSSKATDAALKGQVDLAKTSSTFQMANLKHKFIHDPNGLMKEALGVATTLSGNLPPEYRDEVFAGVLDSVKDVADSSGLADAQQAALTVANAKWKQVLDATGDRGEADAAAGVVFDWEVGKNPNLQNYINIANPNLTLRGQNAFKQSQDVINLRTDQDTQAFAEKLGPSPTRSAIVAAMKGMSPAAFAALNNDRFKRIGRNDVATIVDSLSEGSDKMQTLSKEYNNARGVIQELTELQKTKPTPQSLISRGLLNASADIEVAGPDGVSQTYKVNLFNSDGKINKAALDPVTGSPKEGFFNKSMTSFMTPGTLSETDWSTFNSESSISFQSSINKANRDIANVKLDEGHVIDKYGLMDEQKPGSLLPGFSHVEDVLPRSRALSEELEKQRAAENAPKPSKDDLTKHATAPSDGSIRPSPVKVSAAFQVPPDTRDTSQPFTGAETVALISDVRRRYPNVVPQVIKEVSDLAFQITGKHSTYWTNSFIDIMQNESGGRLGQPGANIIQLTPMGLTSANEWARKNDGSGDKVAQKTFLNEQRSNLINQGFKVSRTDGLREDGSKEVHSGPTSAHYRKGEAFDVNFSGSPDVERAKLKEQQAFFESKGMFTLLEESGQGKSTGLHLHVQVPGPGISGRYSPSNSSHKDWTVESVRKMDTLEQLRGPVHAYYAAIFQNPEKGVFNREDLAAATFAPATLTRNGIQTPNSQIQGSAYDGIRNPATLQQYVDNLTRNGHVKPYTQMRQQVVGNSRPLGPSGVAAKTRNQTGAFGQGNPPGIRSGDRF